MKAKSLRVLMVEDSEDDALLIIRELKKDGYNPVYKRVETAAAMKKALQEKQWDIILCDYKMPRFNAPTAIALLKKANFEIPLIVVTGKIGEEKAAECMRLGAKDYIMNDNLSRLCPAIARELEDAKVRNKQKETEEKLRHEEQRFRAFIENSHDIIAILDRKGIITYENKALERCLGLKIEERIGGSIFDRIHPDDLKSARDAFHKFILNTSSQDINSPVRQIRLRHQDGSWRTFETSASKLLDDNIVESVIISLRDITERKRTENELLKTTTMLESLLDAIPDVIGVQDLGHRIIRYNAAGYALLGQTPEGIAGKKCFEIIGHETPCDICATSETYRTKQTATKEKFVPELGIWLELRSYPVLDANGEIRFVIEHMRDITERKKAENLLRASEDKFFNIFNLSPVLIAISDLQDGTYIDINDNFLTVLGYDRREVVGKSSEELGIIVESQKRSVALNILAKDGLFRDFEIPIRKKNGKICIGLFSGTVINLQDRKVLLTIMNDITERKRADSQKEAALDALRKSEDKYRTLIETTDTGYVIIDQDGLVRDANSEYVRLTGHHDLSEIIGLSVMEWTAKSEKEKNAEAVKACFEKGYIRNLEINYEDAKGNLIPIEINATCINIEGERHTITICRDISERKKSEENLKKTLDSLRKAVGTTIQVLVSAVESRDSYTAGHQSRAADLASAIATEMGLAPEKIEGIRMAGIIHDIGKLSIPAEILSKPTKLTDIEFALIKEHSRSGYEMLKDVESPWPLAEIVYQHHERMNGSGYPRNLKGDEIIIESQILAVADVVEAMASHRPYRPTLGIEAALQEITKNKGILYNMLLPMPV